MDLHVYDDLQVKVGQMLGFMNHLAEDDLQVSKAGQVTGMIDLLVDGGLQT